MTGKTSEEVCSLLQIHLLPLGQILELISADTQALYKVFVREVVLGTRNSVWHYVVVMGVAYVMVMGVAHTSSLVLLTFFGNLIWPISCMSLRGNITCPHREKQQSAAGKK